MSKSKTKYNYIARRGSGSGSGKNDSSFVVDKSDVFIGIIAILVVSLVYYVGNQQPQFGGDGAGKGTFQSSGSESGNGSNLVQKRVQGANNMNSDEPDAMIETKLDEGNDQMGSPKQQLEIDSMDGQKFSLGEGMKGMKGSAQKTKNIERFTVEHAASDMLIDEAKRVKKDVKMSEKSTGSLTGDLENEFDVVKNAVRSNSNSKSKSKSENLQVEDNPQQQRQSGITDTTGTTGTTGNSATYGIPVSPEVGGEPTLDPMDIFSESIAEIQTRPNIDYTGYGHMHYTGGATVHYDHIFYPTDGEDTVYTRQPLIFGKHRKYMGPDGDLTFDDMVRAQDLLQDERNSKGFASDVYGPLEMRMRFKNDKDLMDLSSFDGYKPTKKEYEIGSELGDTGFSWKSRTLNSGIGSQNQNNKKNGNGKGGMYTIAGTSDDGSIQGAGGVGNTPSLRGGNTRGGSIGEESWEKNDADWNRVRIKVRGSVKKMLTLFDRIFSEELFPNAVADVNNDGSMFVRDGKEGKCIMLGRYYEYVQNSIKTQLSLGKPDPMTWAKGVGLRFEDIEANKLPLRAALTEDCQQSKGYIVAQNGTIRAATGQKINITIPWPQDQTTLITHPLNLGKSMTL